MGGWWNFAGSIKWLGTPFDRHDLAELSRDAVQIPGFTPGETGLAVVSRSGASIVREQIDLLWGPEEVLAAWEEDQPARYAEELDQEGGV